MAPAKKAAKNQIKQKGELKQPPKNEGRIGAKVSIVEEMMPTKSMKKTERKLEHFEVFLDH